MSGKLCNGQPNNQSVNLRNSKSFCEGLSFRARGTALAFPVTGNPHEALSPDSLSWIRGWTAADDAAGGVMLASAATCCAVPSTVILA